MHPEIQNKAFREIDNKLYRVTDKKAFKEIDNNALGETDNIALGEIHVDNNTFRESQMYAFYTSQLNSGICSGFWYTNCELMLPRCERPMRC